MQSLVSPAHPLQTPDFPPSLHGTGPTPSQSLQRRPRWGPRARYDLQISDIRHEALTSADARQLLSSYVVIYMEKLDTSNSLDDDQGLPPKPTWRRITFTEERTISQQDIAHKVGELKRLGPPIIDKKNELGPAVQRQIQLAHTKLQEREPDARYHYVLEQLESKLKKIERGLPPCLQSEGKRARGCKCAHASSRCKCAPVYIKCTCSPLWDRCKCAIVGTKCKCGLGQTGSLPKYERVSVTNYFMRTPRPGENALAMLQQQQQQRHQPRLIPPLDDPAGPHSLGRREMPMPPVAPPLSPPRRLGPPSALPSPPPVRQPLPLSNSSSSSSSRSVSRSSAEGGGRRHKQTVPPLLHSVRPGFGIYNNPWADSQTSTSSRDHSDFGSGGHSTARSSSGSSAHRSAHGSGRRRSRDRVGQRKEYYGQEGRRRHYKPEPTLNSPRAHQVPGLRIRVPVSNVGLAGDETFIGGERRRRGAFPGATRRPAPFYRSVSAREALQNAYADGLAGLEDRMNRMRVDGDARLDYSLR